MKHFPFYVDISKKRIAVVGGGKIATRRITTLLSFQPEITVFAPNLTETLREYVLSGKINYIARVIERKSFYAGNDTENSILKKLNQDIILSATDDRMVNHMVYQYAKEHHIPVNVCDCQEECDFFFPAIMESTHAVASITADGDNHALVHQLAEKMRELLQKLD